MVTATRRKPWDRAGRRVRVERGIYRQPNGKYAVCWRHAGKLGFRTVGFDVFEARRERLALIAATREGKVPVSPRLRFETVAGWWVKRFETKVAAGERHPRTLEAHLYQLDRHLLPALGRRGIASLTVDDVAELLHELRGAGRSARRYRRDNVLGDLLNGDACPVWETYDGHGFPRHEAVDHAAVGSPVIGGELERQEAGRDGIRLSRAGARAQPCGPGLDRIQTRCSG
jgi:hypothetical protein